MPSIQWPHLGLMIILLLGLVGCGTVSHQIWRVKWKWPPKSSRPKRSSLNQVGLIPNSSCQRRSLKRAVTSGPA